MFFKKLLPKGGIKISDKKNTADMETVEMPIPQQIILPMVQHIGAPCEPIVKKDDYVIVGQKIADSPAYVSAPIHSGVSGTVSAITQVQMPGGQYVQAVVIDSDGQQKTHPDVDAPNVENFEEFLKAIRQSGLVGLGGAGFPAHVKLNPANFDDIDTIIINAAECEPFITTDYRECIENSWDVLSGIQTVMEFLKAPNVIIAIENNKPEAIKTLSNIARDVSTPQRSVRVKSLKTRYPQGAEKVLIHECIGRKVPPGKLPADIGCIVMNVTSISVLSRYLKNGMPLTTRRVTVEGGAIDSPQNVRVIVGTPIKDIVEFCDIDYEKTKKLLMGGPMMGIALKDYSLPVLKQNNAILALTSQQSPRFEEGPCLRCGRCVSACPMRLVPPSIEAAYMLDDMEALEKYGVGVCMECGCCSYDCPANRFVTQKMRLAKSTLLNYKKNNATSKEKE